jgi:hypothetical protein
MNKVFVFENYSTYLCIDNSVQHNQASKFSLF